MLLATTVYQMPSLRGILVHTSRSYNAAAVYNLLLPNVYISCPDGYPACQVYVYIRQSVYRTDQCQYAPGVQHELPTHGSARPRFREGTD